MIEGVARRELSVVTVVAVDRKASSLSVKDAQGHVVPLTVHDVSQVQKISVGDTVDVTYYESLLIKVARPK